MTGSDSDSEIIGRNKYVGLEGILANQNCERENAVRFLVTH
jgi:hypothetical protein